ncbi:MAG TPA: hemolysin family protein [Terriglobales bacterium]|nr:hemolysin family protein [Terriglobales bacterium]
MFGFLLLRVFAVLLLVAVNAFFVAAEFALVQLRPARIQQLIEAGRTGARTALRLHDHLDTVLAAVQLGITLANLALGFIGEPAIASWIVGLLGHTPAKPVIAHAIAIGLSFILITYVTVILGEIVPKALALQRGERVALAVAAPMDIFIRVASPFLKIIRRSASSVLKIFGIRNLAEGHPHSTEELKNMVTGAHRLGVMPEYQEEMVLRSLDLSNISVREIMTPRNRIFALPANMTLRDALTPVVEEQHSRVPVYDPVRGHEYIIGLLYSKDVSRWSRLRLTYAGSEDWAARLDRMQIRDIMRAVLVVPETKPITDLLQEFKKSRRHLAVVVDEFGSTAGVVTVEDTLEQLVGEIEDEFDITPQPLTAGSSMVLDGATTVRDLETLYQISLPRDEGFETLAGFVLAKLQRLPGAGDHVEDHGRRFTVEQMDGMRISKVKIDTEQPAEAEVQSGNV